MTTRRYSRSTRSDFVRWSNTSRLDGSRRSAEAPTAHHRPSPHLWGDVLQGSPRPPVHRSVRSRLAFFDLGSTRLLLETGAPTASHYLGVDDVAPTTEELRLAGVVIESEPHVVTWTTRVASDLRAKARKMSFFRDSDENSWVSLVAGALTQCPEPHRDRCAKFGVWVIGLESDLSRQNRARTRRSVALAGVSTPERATTDGHAQPPFGGASARSSITLVAISDAASWPR